MTDQEQVERAPWEQLPEEPLAAYRRFLIYRDLGPGRSILRAFLLEKSRKKRSEGYWEHLSARYSWGNRATAWDINNMAEQGAKTVINFVKAMEVLSVKAILDALKPEREIRNLDQLLDVLNAIGSFITPEVIDAARRLLEGDLGTEEENS